MLNIAWQSFGRKEGVKRRSKTVSFHFSVYTVLNFQTGNYGEKSDFIKYIN